MTTYNYDVIIPFGTPGELAALRSGQKGYDITNDRFCVKRLADGSLMYIGTGNYIKADGTTLLTGNWTVGDYNIVDINVLEADSLTISDNAVISTSLDVNGYADIESLTVGANALVHGNLVVDTFIDADSLTVNDNASIANTLDVGDWIHADSLTLDDNATIANWLNIDGSITVDGLATLQDNLVVANSNLSARIAIKTYDDLAEYSELILQKSNTDVLYSNVETIDGTEYGKIKFKGVNSSGGEAFGAVITGVQRGSAGASYVPSEMRIETYGATGLNSQQLVLSENGTIGMGTNSDVETLTLQGTMRVTGGATIDGAAILRDTVDLTKGALTYRITESANGNQLSIYNYTTATDAIVNLFTNEGDGEYDALSRYFGLGTVGDTTPLEWMQIGYNAGKYEVTTRTVDGTQGHLYFDATGAMDQLILLNTGNITTGYDMEVTGGLVAATVTAAQFVPPRISQSTQITPTPGGFKMWRDADDDKTYLVYNDVDVGVRKVELT